MANGGLDFTSTTAVPRWMVNVAIVVIGLGGSAWLNHVQGNVDRVQVASDDLAKEQGQIRERIGRLEQGIEAVRKQGDDTNDRVKNIERLLMDQRGEDRERRR